MQKIIKIFKFMFLSLICILSGCGDNSEVQEVDNYFRNIVSRDELSNFCFETILVYCPLSMEKPIMEIKNIFEEETGCEVQINVASEKALKEQIKSSKKGEVFISEVNDNDKVINQFTNKVKNFAAHKPVLAVKKGNYSGINTLDELMKKNTVFSFCNFEEGIGKVSEKFFKECEAKYLFEYVDNIKEESAFIALDEYENCAAVVWKESCDTQKFDIIELDELDKLYETISAVKLRCSENDGATNEFISFLGSNDAKDILKKYGCIVE